jgi:hypothetical protein
VAEHETFYEETINTERKAGNVYWNRLNTLKRNNVQILYALMATYVRPDSRKGIGIADQG